MSSTEAVMKEAFRRFCESARRGLNPRLFEVIQLTILDYAAQEGYDWREEPWLKPD